MKAKLTEAWSAKFAPEQASLQTSALGLLEQMVALGEDERTVIVNGVVAS
ncbi:MAG: hypothetical protein WKF96_01185 [Solirubrobacteraceae bacterium]